MGQVCITNHYENCYAKGPDVYKEGIVRLVKEKFRAHEEWGTTDGSLQCHMAALVVAQHATQPKISH